MVSSEKTMRVLVTAPPFVSNKDRIMSKFTETNFDFTWKSNQQQLEVAELLDLVANFDGWIIGDDPCTREILEAGNEGLLRAVVKWGVGTDNIDLDAINRLKIRFSNTPGVLGGDVADVAWSYLVTLLRHTLQVHKSVKEGEWFKPTGRSLENKEIAIVGFGDVGRNLAKRVLASNARVNVYEIDEAQRDYLLNVRYLSWPDRIQEMDAVILSCPLTNATEGMINSEIFNLFKKSAIVINVSRGKLIREIDLIEALKSDRIAGAALDVFEVEPLPISSGLRNFENVIFGTHNASNTIEAVEKTSFMTLRLIKEMLN